MRASRHDLGGTVRARDPVATLAWVRPMFPLLGITRVANVTGLDSIGIPVWMCVRPNGRLMSVSQGKGITSELAQVSAVMESIETFHAEHLRPPDVVGAYRSVRRRHAAIDPGALERGTRARAYSPDREIGWLEGRDLATGEAVLVPRAFLDLNGSETHAESGLFHATSTGLASGNVLAEATCHALFEVVERDSEWRFHQLSPEERSARALAPASVEAPMLRAMLDAMTEAGVSVRLWDMTSDVGMPTFLCWIHGGFVVQTPRCGGCGCHLSAEIALSRAITEAAQSRLTHIAGSRDDFMPWHYDDARFPTRESEDAPTWWLRDRKSHPLGKTFDADLRTALGLLEEAGFDRVVVVDITRPDLEVPIVFVVVPGMRELR